MSIKLLPTASEDFWYWYETDKKVFAQLKKLIRDTQRNGTGGPGHPEALSGDLAGLCSKHIDKKNRLVFKIEDNCVVIFSCRGHYADD
jgi:toxin YoeB